MLSDTNGMMNVNKMRQLPADFLINEDGVIVDLFRAKQMSDHMPFERVEAIIPEEKRCKCNKKDCIVSDDIKHEASLLAACSFDLTHLVYHCSPPPLRFLDADKVMRRLEEKPKP